MTCTGNAFAVGRRVGLAFLVMCGVCSGAAAQTCVQPTAGLVGWWAGDNNADDIQNGNNGTLQGGVTFAPGEVDQAFNFDGSTGFVQVPQNSLWEFGSDDFTVDFWINFRTPNTSETLDSPDVFDIIGVDEGEGGTNKWLVRFGGGVLTFHVNDDGTGPGPLFLAQAPFSPNLNQWYFIAVTRSGNTFTTYIDGQAAATETMAVTIPFISAPLTWGLVEAGRFLDGLMDEIEIYNRALSAAEIETIFNTGSAGKCKETEPCTLNLAASVTEGTLTLEVQLGTQAPATWNVWLIAQAEVTPVVSAALPMIAPPASVELDLPFFPALGTVGVLTTLTTSDTGIICSAFSTVDSGPPLAASISLKELVEPHAIKFHDQLRQQHIR